MASSKIDQMNGEEHGAEPNAAEVTATTTTPPARNTLEEYERLFGVDEDAYEQPTTTRKELWAYYLYYNGIGSPSLSYRSLKSDLTTNPNL
jgi:hypothetical protein